MHAALASTLTVFGAIGSRADAGEAYSIVFLGASRTPYLRGWLGCTTNDSGAERRSRLQWRSAVA